MEEERPPIGPVRQRSLGERTKHLVDQFVGAWPPTERQVVQWIRIAISVGVVLLAILSILYGISLLSGITVWNLLKVLAVPITVGAAGPLLNWLQKKRELEVER